MDFLVNREELEALYGLPHAQQLVYLRGIRPFMDVKTGIVGIKRRISLQSLAEEVYIQPHQGVKGEKYSRAQVRRALSALERVGLITLQSEELQLILKCNLSTLGYFVQNKVVTNPSQKAVTFKSQKFVEDKGFYEGSQIKPVTVEPQKADTPLIKENNYIYLLSQFEKFWSFYPEKKSRQSAWEAFQLLNPGQALFNKIIEALQTQIKNREENQVRGAWTPPWKYPANWLTQRCWEDEIVMKTNEEIEHAKHRKSARNESTKDMFWNPGEAEEDQSTTNNIIQFKKFQ